MRVSVIIPTRDRADLLERALASVFAQTTGDFEVIVVDDGSRDHTSKVIDRFDDARLRCIRHTRSMGASTARNSGLRACRGDYVAFLDSDDEWLAAKLERQLEVFGRCSGETGLVYTGAVRVRADGQPRPNAPPRHRGRITKQLLIDNVVGSTSAAMVRRDVFDVVGGFDETLEALQDRDLWLRISCAFDIDFVPDLLVRIHVHDGADRISNNARRKLLGREVFYTKHRELLTKEGLAHRYHSETARLCLGTFGDRRESRRFSRRAIRTRCLSPLGYWRYAASFLPASVRSGFATARRAVRLLGAERAQ